MITKLPRWIEYGAFLLAFIAGCINVIGLLGFEHIAISHVSGTASLLGATIFETAREGVVHLTGILFAFFLGAAISGFLLRDTALTLNRPHDAALAIEALLIFAAFYLLSGESFFGHYAASAAMGVQNALVTTYSGAIVRTTHLTGIFTDLGIMFGSWLRGKPFDRRKAVLFLLIVAGFISGGIFGTFLFQQIAFMAFLIPAFMCLALAVSFRIYRSSQSAVELTDEADT